MSNLSTQVDVGKNILGDSKEESKKKKGGNPEEVKEGEPLSKKAQKKAQKEAEKEAKKEAKKEGKAAEGETAKTVAQPQTEKAAAPTETATKEVNEGK